MAKQGTSHDTVNGVPKNVLLSFFNESVKSLEICSIDEAKSISEIRQIVLNEQLSCLSAVIEDYNTELHNQSNTDYPLALGKVQVALRSLNNEKEHDTAENDLDIKNTVAEMNDAARRAFTRLVLRSACIRKNEKDPVKKNLHVEALNFTEPLQRSEILEFCGLCNIAVQIPEVVHFVYNENHLLFDDISLECSDAIGDRKKQALFPQDRLHLIQRMLLDAMNIDPDHGSEEIKRIFFSSGSDNEFSQDVELLNEFNKMAQTMNTFIVEASSHIAYETFFCDIDEGGVTKVIGVSYSEKLIDPVSGQDIPVDGINGIDEVPVMQRIDCSDNINDRDSNETKETQQNELRIARETSILQQDLLGELLTMKDEERDLKLKAAKEANDNFLSQVQLIFDMSERILFLQSIDPATQKLMAIHKLWENMLAKNGGKPPTTRYNK